MLKCVKQVNDFYKNNDNEPQSDRRICINLLVSCCHLYLPLATITIKFGTGTGTEFEYTIILIVWYPTSVSHKMPVEHKIIYVTKCLSSTIVCVCVVCIQICNQTFSHFFTSYMPAMLYYNSR